MFYSYYSDDSFLCNTIILFFWSEKVCKCTCVVYIKKKKLKIHLNIIQTNIRSIFFL